MLDTAPIATIIARLIAAGVAEVKLATVARRFS
jgi:hypothetical protein